MWDTLVHTSEHSEPCLFKASIDENKSMHAEHLNDMVVLETKSVGKGEQNTQRGLSLYTLGCPNK